MIATIMFSPHKTPGGGASPRTAAPLRGLFLDGVWRCNCPERPPAIKLQTKNHGVNHGRWFYTCQRPQQHRCNFFLWASDAEAREKLAVLNNSHSESSFTARTPSKTPRYSSGTGLLTPQTDSRRQDVREPRFNPTPSKSAKAKMMSEDTEEFSWDESENEEVTKWLERPRQPDFGSQDGPRKVARTDGFGSPGKRKLSDMENDISLTPKSVFSSRATDHFPPSSAEISMTPTPSKYTNVLSADSGGDSSELALQALKILETHNVVVPKEAQDELTGLLNKYDLKTKGISRGRDISRIALKKKDEQILKLNEKITILEAERRNGFSFD